MTELPTTPLPAEQLDARGIADALDRAAILIETNGLTTGEYWTGELFATRWTEGRGCDALGAIGVAVGYREHVDIDSVIVGVDRYDPKLHANVPGTPHPVVAALMAHRGTDDPVDLMNWSDTSRDSEVVAELRTCAAALRIHADDVDITRIAAGELVTTDAATVALSLAHQAGAVTR